MHAVSKSLIIMGLVAGGAPALAKVDVATRGTQTTYDFHLDGLATKEVAIEGQAFVKAALTGAEGYEAVRFREGEPEIPVVRFFVDGAGEVDVTLVGDEPRSVIRPGYPALPGILSAAKLAGARPRVVRDRAAYADPTPQPAADFEVETIGTIRGVPRRMISVYPVKYAAASNTWSVRRDFRVTFTKDLLARPAPAQVGMGTIALVVGEQFEHSAALGRLRDLKQGQGYKTVTLVARRDHAKPEDIRAWLRREYAGVDGLQSVLIVGDAEDVPAYESQEISGVTDHYYRALDTDAYEADIGTPDVGLGRIAVSTEADLATVVDKTATYENGAFRDRSWLGKVEWIASNDSWNYAIAEGSFNYAIDKYTKAQAWMGSFPAASQLGGDQLYAITYEATSQDVVRRMREGRALINYGGHGDTNEWVGPEITVEDVQSLDHPEALPVVIANACITGQFTGESFGETWLKARHGAVVYWGSMDSTYWDEDDILQRKLYDVVFGDGMMTVAAFTEASLAEVWRYYGGRGRSKYYFETYVVFGDPTLRMRLEH